ncbi:AAA family ATPase [Ginsengibacter hankyongi]|uniref:AAA family ATPase n=1 Tax=Ginsengibacter hankyongi TaxID=2607284 RepID=A0A5J5ICG2_9BACT|nr:AAA family ATPase [Ginsengibacter hankyongi]KAA9035649.1 AAA family ATPase [Ginsengibacter hankyongi]
MVVIVFGLPGSGKSYFAERLAKLIKADYINSDRVRKELFKKRTYSKAEKQSVYDEMLATMKDAVDQDRNVVLDATFHTKETRNPFVKEMKSKGGIYFIEVTANEELIRERLKKARPYSEADFKIYKIIGSDNEPLKEPHLVLQSTNNNIGEMLQKAYDYLK